MITKHPQTRKPSLRQLLDGIDANTPLHTLNAWPPETIRKCRDATKLHQATTSLNQWKTHLQHLLHHNGRQLALDHLHHQINELQELITDVETLCAAAPNYLTRVTQTQLALETRYAQLTADQQRLREAIPKPPTPTKRPKAKSTEARRNEEAERYLRSVGLIP